MNATAMRLIQRLGLYEAVAFISGFVLMAYELAASRMLAPTIGTSIYVWTSVIGVMIAALACGYAAGGWVADRRERQQDVVILLIGAALAMTVTCLFATAMLTTVIMLTKDPRLQGVIAAAVLFAPASFAMGMVSPYLAKLRIRSLNTTGRSVATLSALNSVGGIAGTFLTGFIFFNYIGSRQTLMLLVVLLLACSWLVAARRHTRDRVVISLVLCGTLALQMIIPIQAGAVVDIDTPTSHYKVADIQRDGRQLRLLAMGPGGFQSGVYITGSKDLAFGYTRKIADVVQAVPHKDRILILGGGAFTLPEYLGRQYPDARIDVVEIDPQLPGIARTYFRYQPTANIHVTTEDARAYLRTTNARYNVAIIDVYNDAAVPFSLTTREYANSLKHIMQPDGVIAANFIAATNTACLPLLSAMHASYAASFNDARLYPLGQYGSTAKANIIAVYSNTPLQWADHLTGQTISAIPAGQPLTDDFAPTEHLIQQCR